MLDIIQHILQGKHYVNIREYYQKGTELKPSKKGVALNQDEWRKLKDSFNDIDAKIPIAGAEDPNPIEISDKKQISVSNFKVCLFNIRKSNGIKIIRETTFSLTSGSSTTKMAKRSRAEKESL